VLVDSHAHLDSPRYEGDLAAVLANAWAAGVKAIVSVGIGDGPETMHRALDLAREYARRPETPAIFATAGVHPHEAALADQAALEKLDSLLGQPEIIAAGEIGLDYFYDHSPRGVQKQAFRAQMELTARHRKPIIIHCRPSEGSSNAWDDALAEIESHWKPTGLRGILHCFTGEWEHARRALDCGFLISFAGNLTFPKAQPIRDVAARVPLDAMLVETDAPFLAPLPYRGKRNEPAWVKFTGEKLAEILRIEVNDMAAATTRNFGRLFPSAEAVVRLRG
jgi:TatD DNase family protein